MIRKWPMEIGADNLMPANTEILHFGEQDGRLYIWTRNRETGTARVEVAIYGTGMTPPERADYYGTVQASDGLVWHLFGMLVPT